MCKITRDIFVFPFYGGEILCLDYKTGAVKFRKSHGPGIMGSVALNNTSNKFVAYTGKNFQLYRLSSLELLKTFTAETPVVLFPKYVVFGELEKIIVGGPIAAAPCCMMFRVKRFFRVSGTLTEDSFSQYHLPERHLIAIAGSTAQQAADVIIFEKQIPDEEIRSDRAADVPMASSADSILIGFYLPKKIWYWMRILGVVMVFLASVGYFPTFYVQMSQIPPFRRDPLNNKPDNIKKGLHGEMSSDQYIDVTHRTTKRNAVTNGERKRNSDLNVVLQKALAVVD
ncbi:hypothetical protein EV368DRAFT_61420 [Lentinula lateritia]|nr:hypothetical protein EV368DRAFT_61420 [Lentinula lateritia]